MAWVTANDSVTLNVTITAQDGSAVDLTGTTVYLYYYINAHPPVEQRTMTIASDPKTGVATYAFVGTDLSTPGTLYYQVQVLYSNGNKFSSPFFGELLIAQDLSQ